MEFTIFIWNGRYFEAVILPDEAFQFKCLFSRVLEGGPMSYVGNILTCLVLIALKSLTAATALLSPELLLLADLMCMFGFEL